MALSEECGSPLIGKTLGKKKGWNESKTSVHVCLCVKELTFGNKK